MSEPETREQAMEKLFNCIKEELQGIVQGIESKHATTQNHYGDYMSAIHQLNQARIRKPVAAELLIMAGANAQGVKSALALS